MSSSTPAKIILPGVISEADTDKLMALYEKADIDPLRSHARRISDIIKYDMANRARPEKLPDWPNQLLAQAKAGGWGLLAQQISIKPAYPFINPEDLVKILKALSIKPSGDSYLVAQMLLYGYAEKRNAS